MIEKVFHSYIPLTLMFTQQTFMKGLFVLNSEYSEKDKTHAACPQRAHNPAREKAVPGGKKKRSQLLKLERALLSFILLFL